MEAQRKVVAVGASAGGVEALRTMAAGLPPDLAAPVLVVLHIPRDAPSALPRILNRSGPLPASTAVDGEALWPGRIYVAPADRHLLLLHDRIRLSRSPAENGHRPSIDPMFRSVARASGPNAVAVILSGARDDGAIGAASVAAHGGTVLVQDPADATYASMPRAALALVPQARAAGAAGLAKLIGAAVADVEPPVAQLQPGEPTEYRCPSCGRPMSMTRLRFRCAGGHVWTSESLLAEHAAATEGALWMALRALEEKSALSRRMADGRSIEVYRRRFAQVADDADQAGVLIRRLIARLDDHPL